MIGGLNICSGKYRGLAAVIGYGVVGLIMETYGAMAPEFRELVEQLVGDAMRNEQLSLAQAKQLQIHTFASLAVALHRGNVKLVLCSSLSPSRTICVVLVFVPFRLCQWLGRLSTSSWETYLCVV